MIQENNSDELINANKELAFQNEEKEKRAEELAIANFELAFQIEENDKRTSELTIANKELFYQNIEKGKRAAELIIANKELAFQNTEKEKRAAELTIANKELFYQNIEKGKRASELVIANIELANQNEEKERRSADLTKAYNELEKTEEYLNEYIQGLEKMMFMTSHKVRQPVTNILGLSNQLDELINSPEELKKLIDYIKQSALSLDDFTKELTAFISGMEKNSKIKTHDFKHLFSTIIIAPLLCIVLPFII